MVQIRRKGPKRSEHVGMQKGANFTIVSTMVLIGLNIKFFFKYRGGFTSKYIERNGFVGQGQKIYIQESN